MDVDDSPKLCTLLGVCEIPTLVLLADGKPVARLEGRASAPEIERLLNDHLPARNPDRSLAA